MIPRASNLHFQLTAYWQKKGPQAGRKLEKTTIGFFEDITAAKRFLKNSNPAGSLPYLFYFELGPAVIPLSNSRSVPIGIFDRNGRFCGGYNHYIWDNFKGRTAAQCRFRAGDIVQFGHSHIELGVVWALPPSPSFVDQNGFRDGYENGMFDDADDTYHLLYGKSGMGEVHLHECQMFVPEAPIPNSVKALQKSVLEANRPGGPVRESHLKEFFFRWAEENKELFSHEPYLVREYRGGFDVKFRGISEYIFCEFIENYMISIDVHYRNKLLDPLDAYFHLEAKQTHAGRFHCKSPAHCGLCCDHPEDVPEYETMEDFWIEHTFKPFARWTRETFADDSVLCLYTPWCPFDSQIASGAELEELRIRGGIMKETKLVKRDIYD